MLELLHFITAASVLYPIYVLYKIQSKTRGGEFESAFFRLIVGILPLALYYLLEAIATFTPLPILSDEAGFLHQVSEHVVVVIAFISVGWFMSWFAKHFVSPIYGKT